MADGYARMARQQRGVNHIPWHQRALVSIVRLGQSSYSRNGSQIVNIPRRQVRNAAKLLAGCCYSEERRDPSRSLAIVAERRLLMIRAGTLIAAEDGKYSSNPINPPMAE